MKREPRTSARPKLPMTLRGNTRIDGPLRVMRAEDTIVCEPGMEVSLAAVIAAEAITRMDAELRPLREGNGPKPYVYPIFEEDRRMVERLKREHPPTAQVAQRASSILNRLSNITTCDELALAAVKAAEWFRLGLVR